MIEDSKNYPHVFQLTETTELNGEDRPFAPGWYFWDEVGYVGGGPYETEEEANKQLDSYCYHYLTELDCYAPDQEKT